MDQYSDPVLVSVVIPTYNRAHLVARAILSVLAQTYQRFEILVIDDASTDATAKVVSGIADPRIRYLPQPLNQGASASRNIGAQLARGDYVAYLDSDDTWEPEKLELQMGALGSHPDPSKVVCYTQSVIYNGQTRRTLPARGKESSESVADYLFGNDGLLHTSTILLPRNLALAVPFNTTYRIMEDWDLFFTFEQRGVEWLFLRKPLSVWHAERRSGRLSGSSKTEECLLWLRDHESSFSTRAKHRFMLQTVLPPLIGRGEQKRYAFRIVVDAVRSDAIGLRPAALYSAKIITPKWLKSAAKGIHQRLTPSRARE